MHAFIDEHLGRWPVAAMCRAIEASERSYYAARRRQPSARAIGDEALLAQINAVRSGRARCYGAYRTWVALKRKGIEVGRCRVERVMPTNGLVGVLRGRRKRTTIADETAARPADLVDRQFRTARPNQLWVADITYASTWEGWLYVALRHGCPQSARRGLAGRHPPAHRSRARRVGDGVVPTRCRRRPARAPLRRG